MLIKRLSCVMRFLDEATDGSYKKSLRGIKFGYPCDLQVFSLSVRLR